MSSKQDKKVIVLVYYPEDDWVMEIFDTIFHGYIPDGLSYTFECNTHKDLVLDDMKVIKDIEESDKSLYFLRAVFPAEGEYKVDRKVYYDNVSFLTRRFAACFPMLKIDPKEYHPFDERNYRTVSDILLHEFIELSKAYTRITGKTIPATRRQMARIEYDDDDDKEEEEKDKGDEADSEPEKEKEKQDDITSEEPETKKMKTTEEN